MSREEKIKFLEKYCNDSGVCYEDCPIHGFAEKCDFVNLGDDKLAEAVDIAFDDATKRNSLLNLINQWCWDRGTCNGCELEYVCADIGKDFKICRTDKLEQYWNDIRNINKPVDLKLLRDLSIRVEPNEPNDAVEHPNHYNQGGIECWDAMKQVFGKDALATFCKLNAFKYLWRASDKNGLEDIYKAINYLNKYKELSEGE